jgi:cellulase
MQFGKLCAILLLFTSLCFGHTYFSSITVDGVVNKEGDCIRPHPSSKYDYPISALDRPNGLSSDDMTCGWLPSASKPANKKCPVNPGSKIVIQWHYEMGLGASDDFIIDPSHKGPCLVYMAKSETGTGPVWFKIFEDGYDTTTKKFCVDKLRANKGKLEVTIPTDITPGNYLFRAELIALHEGFELTGAQPYVGCAEITVGGSGTVNPGNLVSFPGAYSPNDAGIFFNVYSGNIKSYPIPGPALYKSGSNPTPTPTPNPTPAATTAKVIQGSSTGSSRGSTTGKGTSVSTGSSQNTGSNGGDTDEMMCYLPSTPNINGKINKNSGKCGKNDKTARCYEGQCCSKFGFCGSSSQYCNADSSADYRKVKCSSVGLKFSNAAEEKIEIVEDDPNVEASYGIRNTMVAGLTIAAMFAAFA